MPRPLRLEYKDAFYHVMNRGRGRQTIFHDRDYYQAFLDCLAEVHVRFAAEIHAYCLMRNHYHLLIKTPFANLSRIMRHINGIYTQRHNRFKHTDGPLFRGRYRAIVVDADNYLLQVSRYIHRNPIDLRKPLVAKLENYAWSSYGAYINKTRAPTWLERALTYKMLGKRQYYACYKTHVEQGNDEEIQQFYSKGNLASVMGDKTFREQLQDEADVQDKPIPPVSVHGRPPMGKLINAVAKAYNVTALSLTQPQQGLRQANLPRKYAMYVGQQVGYSLKELADAFSVNHVGTISHALTHVRQLLRKDMKLAKKLDRMKQEIW